MTFDQVEAMALLRVADQLAGNPTPDQLSRILLALAALRQATQPNVLAGYEFSGQVTLNQNIYTLEGITGNPGMLIVNGLVIRKQFWSWDADTKHLTLNNSYRIQPGQTAELYYVPL